jgi:hypothetical protein
MSLTNSERGLLKKEYVDEAFRDHPIWYYTKFKFVRYYEMGTSLGLLSGIGISILAKNPIQIVRMSALSGALFPLLSFLESGFQSYDPTIRYANARWAKDHFETSRKHIYTLKASAIGFAVGLLFRRPFGYACVASGICNSLTISDGNPIYLFSMDDKGENTLLDKLLHR